MTGSGDVVFLTLFGATCFMAGVLIGRYVIPAIVDLSRGLRDR